MQSIEQEEFVSQPIRSAEEYKVFVKQLYWLAEQYDNKLKSDDSPIPYDLLPRWLDIVNTIGYLGALDDPLRNALKQYIDELALVELQQTAYQIERQAERALQRDEEYWRLRDPESIARMYYNWFMRRSLKQSVREEYAEFTRKFVERSIRKKSGWFQKILDAIRFW